MAEQDNNTILNNNFFFNSLLARALIQLLPLEERELTHSWLSRLQKMDSNLDEMTIRNDYLWFLLLAMQYDRKLVAPFDQEPPEGDIHPLPYVVPHHVYEEVLYKTENTFKWIDHLLNVQEEKPKEDKPEGTQTEVNIDDFNLKLVRPKPAAFLATRPKPRKGSFCYMAAFSKSDHYH